MNAPCVLVLTVTPTPRYLPLFCEYGYRDVIIIDDNFAHGFTTLQTLLSIAQQVCTQIERHSNIIFNCFQREKLKKEHTYTSLSQDKWYEDMEAW